MCITSYVGDYWRDQTFPQKYPELNKQWYGTTGVTLEFVTKEEFESLKKDIQEFKTLLLAAKQYDEKVGEPDCEMESKVLLIKEIAKAVGVDMKDVFADA